MVDIRGKLVLFLIYEDFNVPKVFITFESDCVKAGIEIKQKGGFLIGTEARRQLYA